jgi:hypothetical protein
MVTSSQCLAKFGPATKDNPWLVLWDVPTDLEIGVIPKRIYCNKLMVEPLTEAFINMISRGYAESELLTWDGCFNIRNKTAAISASLHSWAIAVDVNAFENPYNRKPKMSAGFVECWTDAGFDWGGIWRKPDGMHFQLRNI